MLGCANNDAAGKPVPDDGLGKRPEQQQALLATEGVEINFTKDGIRRIAEMAYEVNERTENIGARRLSTIMERLFDDLSYHANERSGQTVSIDADFVSSHFTEIIKDEDLTKYIL